ncbi:polyadenylate-binding protein RBP47-like [Panicum miliaceum]|uniref:Polyadenylate-binding protein RBP47-like n=1 Tax=Panicum miliaceum TaxID=4540 RepID=A0A3L6QRV4_PANMI|nr:polyadenylate-binding protein RBP47-like [Panicum miliaceum]
MGSPAPHQAGQEENKTIWVGDLHYWMDENYLHSCFGYTGEVVAIKVIRNKQTGQSEGYGFVEFYSHAAAEKVLEGDLASDVNDATLLETFSSRYSSVKGAKVVIDANTGRSKGYGFVRFGDDSEKTHAMTEMNGVYCSSRPMRIGPATPRKSSGTSGSNGSSARSDGGDLTNTTVFVGGLDPNVSEEDLRQTFSQYGEISSVKIPVGKQCGFVQFAQRKNAEDALQGLNGSTIGKQTVRLSWGRNPANKQFRGDNGNQWNNGMYYAASPFYNGYGYPAAPFPDPGMYAAPAYGAYPFYGNQQQVS